VNLAIGGGGATRSTPTTPPDRGKIETNVVDDGRRAMTPPSFDTTMVNEAIANAFQVLR
jgi:hypothetical protein